eukprot:gene1750-2657_t
MASVATKRKDAAPSGQDYTYLPQESPARADSPKPPAKTKSVLVAYLCWLVGGWFGLHHWYLERNSQAILWTCSAGGFGIGCFLDFFYIPTYVQEYNEGIGLPKRVFSFGIMMGYYAFAEFTARMCYFLGPEAAWLVGTVVACLLLTIGRRRMKAPSYTALIVLACRAMFSFNDADIEPSYMEAAQGAVRDVLAWACQGSLPPEKPTPRSSFTMRLALFFATLFAMGVVTCNYEIETDNGFKTTLAGGIRLVAVQLKTYAVNIYEELKRTSWEDMGKILMPKGEQRALSVLGLGKGATPAEIKKAWRQKQRELHRDINPDAPAGALEEVNE